jgi:hypothetical protein
MAYKNAVSSAKPQHSLTKQLLAESALIAEAKTEEQMEADKVKRQAKIKHQNELNSRLSVKKSALGKMLEAQKRKERIVNGHKADLNSIDRESGSLFRGMGGNRNRSSRLGGEANQAAQ